MTVRLLVLHQNIPGQFGHLVLAIGRDSAPGLPVCNGLICYKPAPDPDVHRRPCLRTPEQPTRHAIAP